MNQVITNKLHVSVILFTCSGYYHWFVMSETYKVLKWHGSYNFPPCLSCLSCLPDLRRLVGLRQVMGGDLLDTLALNTHMNNDSFIQQALLLRSHDKVVSVVLVVYNVLEINACKIKTNESNQYVH